MAFIQRSFLCDLGVGLGLSGLDLDLAFIDLGLDFGFVGRGMGLTYSTLCTYALF